MVYPNPSKPFFIAPPTTGKPKVVEHAHNHLDMNLKIERGLYEAISKEIHSDKSPVGIDAKKTHVLILQKLMAIEERLERMEQKLAGK